MAERLKKPKKEGQERNEKVENGVQSQGRIPIDVTLPKEKVHIPRWDATVAVIVLR